jgi:hypothetical protein
MAAEATSIPTISSGNLGRRRQPISGTQTARALCEVRASRWKPALNAFAITFADRMPTKAN